jgi:hypothetical protein
MSNISTRVSGIVLPVAESTSRLPLQAVENPALVGIILRQQIWAPAWFYSALNWLSRTYTDANNAQQSFDPSMYGSDVDPYAQLGSTCLFCITQQRNSVYFTLYLAQDTDSVSLGAGNTYPNTDDGITAMYTALSASSIFSAVKFCYIPGLLGSDINPTAYTASAFASAPPSTLQSGYDPATGLRVIAQGSAVSQVVPLDQFQTSHNEQIYDTTPAIVPIASSLVYDVTQFNQLGATQFLVPVFYARDRVQSSYYVNKIGGPITISNQTAQCGQISVYAGGPGYNASTATQLALESVAAGQPLSTYTFSNNNGIIVVSSVNPGSGVNAGITSLTYSASSPAALFANQRLVGFARSSAWQTSFGIPIFDYGSGNSSFALPPSVAGLTPTAIYNPTTPFLNGGSLANVVRSLLQATYLYPPSKLISILNTATTSQTTDGGAGLSVTTAALQFAMSSNETTIADQLSIPVVATFITTPATYLRPVLNQTGAVLATAGSAQPVAASSVSPASASVAAPSAIAAKVAPAATTAAPPSSSTLQKIVNTIQAASVAPATPVTNLPSVATTPVATTPITTTPVSTAPPAAAGPPTATTPVSTTPPVSTQAPSSTAAPVSTVGIVVKKGTTVSIPDPTRLPVQQEPPIPIPVPLPKAPSTITVGLSASIPKEALTGTGISSIEIGTIFAQQNLGAGSGIQAATGGTIVNLMDRTHPNAAIVPFALTLSGLGLNFTAGITYVLSLSGGTLTARGSDQSAASVSASPQGAAGGFTYVGSVVYSATSPTVQMYPLLQLPFTPPAVGTNGTLQGVNYNLRLTYGATGSVYDITDSGNSTVATNIAVANPVPTDKSTPAAGDLYFGSFVGGATQTTLWAVPVFLNVIPSQLTGISYAGNVTLNSESSGVPSYDLNITDTSLFIYSNINVDTLAIGSVSAKNVYLASAVINSAPDDITSAAFAPCKLLMGLVRQAQVGTGLQYVFVPEDDSVAIGGTRYMLSVINLGNLTLDPNSLPYPPVFWPQSQYWQFANRHNPYLDVDYTGETQQARIDSAQQDVASIGLALSQAQEPMQMYLDTNANQMTAWPIYAFPFEATTQTVDVGQLKNITETVLNILAQYPLLASAQPASTQPLSSAVVADSLRINTGIVLQAAGSSTSLDAIAAANANAISVNTPVSTALDAEQVTVPSVLTLPNPYASDAATSPDTTPAITSALTQQVLAPAILGKQVQNLAPNVIDDSSVAPSLASQASRTSLQNQQAEADLAAIKNLAPVTGVLQDRAIDTTAVSSSAAIVNRRFQPIYGFSVYNSATGEAYIIEVVGSDITPPDQLPYPTQNLTYDPFYVRVVFLNRLTCYNMSIIVPSMVYDQYGHLAQQNTSYQNLLSKSDELGIGYLYSIYDNSNNFDNINVQVYQPDATKSQLASENYLFTNFQYRANQLTIFNPGILFQNLASVLTQRVAINTVNAAPRSLALNVNALNANAIGINSPALSLQNAAFSLGEINYFVPQAPPVYFFCRRQNWNADCHLMQATNPSGTAVYMAFGGGDLVPFRLDAPFTVDKRQPDHMYKFTASFADQQYTGTQTVSVANTPYIVGVTTQNGFPQYNNLSINSTAGTADIQVGGMSAFTFPTECYVAGAASTMFTTVSDINTALKPKSPFQNTGQFASLDADGSLSKKQEFQLVPYNNLVYLVRAVSNSPALGAIGGLGVTSGLLIDTYVPTASGNLALAQGARYKRSGMQYFGSSYTPVTMVDSLDTLDFTSITGGTFYAPTIFIPIAELDASKGIVANLSNFLGQQMWTFVYAEIIAQPGETVNGVPYPSGFNLDGEGKPVLSLQKLHFVYDPLATLFTPNDLTHKYPLQPKQRILALTNDQIREGICWRSANPLPGQLPPHNICAQQILPTGAGMDRPNIIYSAQNRPVITSSTSSYLGMSVHRIIGISGAVYNIEESGFSGDQTTTTFVSSVSSDSNLVISVLFDYDNNNLGNMTTYDPRTATRGLVFLNGYLGANGYMFSSPDHFDVNDILPSYAPQLEQVTNIMGQGWDFGFYNVDLSLPRQFWSLAYDAFTAVAIPNFIPNVPPSLVDPTFTNRTRSLVLTLQNNVRPNAIGLMDTYSSVVSANLHLQNGVTGSIFLSKKADRDVASIGTNPAGPSASVPAPNTFPLYGLPTKYDFFIFSRDHYWTLNGASFELIDMGYAMCLVDDGTGTGNKVASFYVDSDGNYYELYNYVLYSPGAGVIETQSQPFILKVTLGAPANPGATPPISETPNNVNPQDLVTQINKLSNLIYAVMGPSSPGQPPAYLPIQSIGGPSAEIQAGSISGAPGFNGYALNVMGASNHLPIQIIQIYSGSTAYTIAGTTTLIPYNTKGQKAVPFYGSLSHGLDKQRPWPTLYSADGSTTITNGVFGGDGLGSMLDTPLGAVFQGSGAIPATAAGSQAVGAVMKADTPFYTYNAVSNITFDSTNKTVTATGGQYFIDTTDPANPIYVVVTLPKFVNNTNTYNINLNTTLPDGVTPCYTLVAGGKSYLFNSSNQSVTADRTVFTFNPGLANVFTVSYADVDAPTGSESPSPIVITPFSIAAGGVSLPINVFNTPALLSSIQLGVVGRTYNYNPTLGTVTITQSGNSIVVPIQTGLTFISSSGYGYVIGFSHNQYLVNGKPMFPYNASIAPTPASYPLLTAPQMFTVGGNFYTFDQDSAGNYLTVTGNGQTYPVNPYQFSINGQVYILNTSVQPNQVVGGGNVYTMTSANTQFVIDGVQYTIALKGGSLNGATISGQFNITQGNVIVMENYVYELDTMNGQIVGNGTTYPLTTSGFTYTITTANSSFTVTTQPNATTVTIGTEVYQINNTTVVGDGVTYPILIYRTFTDGASSYSIGFDGTAYTTATLSLTGIAPAYTGATFTDGAATYTVNEVAAFDGTKYYLMTGATGSPLQFTAGATTYLLRTDGVAVTNGANKTYLVNQGPLSPNQFAFGSETIFFGRSQDLAAFDGQNYYAIISNQFTDNHGNLYTLSGNTAVNAGNSYEIFSNLGQGGYFQVPNGPTYLVNVAVADTGSATGNIYSVFPIASGSFAMPIVYTVTATGGVVTVAAITIPGGSTTSTAMTASGADLTGGSFTDSVTGITYNCVVEDATITFVDSNNTVYSYPSSFAPNTFVAEIAVSTAVNLAVDSGYTTIYAVNSNQFVTPTATYTVKLPVAYSSAAGAIFPMVNGRFTVPSTTAASSVVYSVKGSHVTKGYLISGDNEFTPDGNTVYTVDAVNVVKSSNQGTLSTTTPQTLTVPGVPTSTVYTLNTTTSLATTTSEGLTYNNATPQFTVIYNSGSVTYSVNVGALTVTDNRTPANKFTAAMSGTVLTFVDTASGITFSFDSAAANGPITVGFPYTSNFFVDTITNITYYIDTADNRIEGISYLPENTQYAFVPADGNTYLIHYNNVGVVFPVIAGAQVNAGVATVGLDTFTVHIDKVAPTSGGAGINVNTNSFEVNGNLYTIQPTATAPSGSSYAGCIVTGDNITPTTIAPGNTFHLTDPTIPYTLQLDANNQPVSVLASFPVLPSRDLISIADQVYIITYNTVSTGSLLGQGRASIPIANSGFTLTNNFDATKATFIFDDLNIYDAGSVVGQFTAYLSPTFFLNAGTYTLDTVNLIVLDNNKRPYPLAPNPTMFSINGANYLIDTNRVPHSIIGNNNISPVSTDVTVQRGLPVPNSTFTLGGLVYKYTEDAQGNLVIITGTKLYLVDATLQTFKLDSSLVFTISLTVPATGAYPGVAPIATITAGPTTTLYIYKGIAQAGNADFFMYKNVLYTLLPSATAGKYEAVQKSYPVYASVPAASQQQLAVFDLNGNTYIVTDGTTADAATSAGISPGSIWSQTALSNVELQYGLVYGFASQPTNVIQSSDGKFFQFLVTDASGNTTLYNIQYTAGANTNAVVATAPQGLPSFTQVAPFIFTKSFPLTFETGGYNAFSPYVDETNQPERSFALAYRTPVVSTSPNVDQIIGAQGDFSVEFWHSLPLHTVTGYHPFTYSASNQKLNVYRIDVDFENATDIYVQINNTVLHATTVAPMILSGWRHFALAYVQPYTMLCNGAGFEVKDGSHYDFSRDFSIGMTFSVSDTQTEQALLYKGTGSSNTPPHLDMSYRVEVSGGNVTLTFKDDTGQTQTFTGPSVAANQYYELIIVKKTSTGGGQEGTSPDPYALPFDLSELQNISKGTNNIDMSNVPPSGGNKSSSFSNVSPQPVTGADSFNAFTDNMQSNAQGTQRYIVSLSVRPVLDNGDFGDWSNYKPLPNTVSTSAGLEVNATGAAHLLIGDGYDDHNVHKALGSTTAGNIRDVYLFNTAINPKGISTTNGVVTISQATQQELAKAGLLGFWSAAYDPNGVVNNAVNANDVAISTSAKLASLAPLTGHEAEGASIYVNGVAVPFDLITSNIPASITSYSPGTPTLTFNAGLYKLQELAMWNMARQAYQVMDDMFGQLIPLNEPLLSLYLTSSHVMPDDPPVPLPLNLQLDNAPVKNGAALDLQFSNASLDFTGTPCVARCGPLVTANLYTPPGVALTVCDTPPSLTSYSITLNSTTGTPAGEINEAYVYLKDHVLMLYAGKKIGDLVLSWVSQEQGDVQVLGYIEGAPPAPMANLTNKASYAGATSVTFTVPTSGTLKYQMGGDSTNDIKLQLGNSLGASFGVGWKIAPFGLGVGSGPKLVNLGLKFGQQSTLEGSQDNGNQQTATSKYDESHKYTVKMQGTILPYTNDLFMGTLNTLTTPSNTAGNPASKTAILPNPNLGGFTTSNPPSALPKTQPTEEKYGQRMFQPSPYGQAFVLSQTLDVYQQTLLQTNTVYGFVRVPNAQIPPDFNIVSFRLSSKYIRPGVLDGMIGYAYNPATLANGAQTYTTSTGQLTPVYDGNFDQGSVGHQASYMRVIEAYQLKKQIDLQTFNAIALYRTAYQNSTAPLTASLPVGALLADVLSPVSELLPPGVPGLPALDPAQLLSTTFGPLANPLQLLTSGAQAASNLVQQYLGLGGGNSPGVDPSSLLNTGLDFYNEYVWSSRGGSQEIKHTITSAFDQVYTANNLSSSASLTNFEVKLSCAFLTVFDFKLAGTQTQKQTMKYSYSNTASVSFDITASFEGIESDTQMHYSSNNDAHFVMNYNSMFNPNNQSGLNLVIGSDGLVYQIAPSVTSGAGLPMSDNVDTNQTYMQPQPSYTTGNADGLSGTLEPYDRPGKTSLFRTYSFFLQPSLENATDFWNTVIDRKWLANSQDADAIAMRSAQGNTSIPWRLMYRVTYSQRFLPPVSDASAVVPQITPVMAVPVTNPAANFLSQPTGSTSPAPANNPANDIESNVVLVAPTQSGLSAYSTPTSGPNPNMPVLPNNVIPFDLFKGFTTVLNYGITSWGDTVNTKILTQLMTSVLGQNAVVMTASVLPGSTKVADVLDPVGGGVLYTVYLDPNGLTVNVPAKVGITVLADVNGNPIQYFDGKTYHSLQADYIASPDGTIMYYIQPPSTYDQSHFDLAGDYDPATHPGDEWRYYLVSGASCDMTSEPTVNGSGVFRGGNTAFTVAEAQHDKNGNDQVQGFILIRGILQWPHLNSNAEIFSDVLVYKSMSLFDTFPIGDPEVLTNYLTAQYPGASFVTTPNADVISVFVNNIISYFNSAQAALNPQ